MSRDALFREGDADRLFMPGALAETCAWGGLGSCLPRITAALTTAVTKEYGADWRGLEAVWRLVIINTETRQLILALCGDRTDPQDFSVGDDGFFALLGTENGRAPCRMLASYPGMFGRKHLSKVRVFPRVGSGMGPNICWFLEDAPPPPTPPSPDPFATPDRPLSHEEARRYKKRVAASHSSGVSPATPPSPVTPMRREPFLL